MNEFNLETRINYNEVVKSNVSWIAHESLEIRLFSNGVHKKINIHNKIKMSKINDRKKPFVIVKSVR